jgi:hypothetical protein
MLLPEVVVPPGTGPDRSAPGAVPVPLVDRVSTLLQTLLPTRGGVDARGLAGLRALRAADRGGVEGR